MSDFVLDLGDPRAEVAVAGGKGASLARLAAAELPVPNGFHITTSAYRAFVDHHGLGEEIAAAAAGAAGPQECERAERAIRALFADREPPGEVAEAVLAAYAELGRPAVAVRSSATTEDLPGMSSAGQQDSYLGVRGDEALLDAVRRCWASLWNARAIGYRAGRGAGREEPALAVVVQELVDAEAAGVLFTADPLTGERGRVVVNAAWGLGEALVGGHVTPDTAVVDAAAGRVVSQSVAVKEVMTVAGPEGTREVPVPDGLRSRPVLTAGQAVALAALGTRIDELYGTAVDVEWVRSGGELSVVQARPVTGTRYARVAKEAAEWNDSLRGFYLWTSTNLGEALPEVMTPCTWSLVRSFIGDTMATSQLRGHPLCGVIGGRFYLNLSFSSSAAEALGSAGMPARADLVFGTLPAGLSVPLLPVSRWQVIRDLVPTAVRMIRRIRTNLARMPGYLAAHPALCRSLRERIAAIEDPAELAALWRRELAGRFRMSCQMLEAGARSGGQTLMSVPHTVRELVGEADAALLLSGYQGDAAGLASLGPVVGLTEVAKGRLGRDDYVGLYGHRAPNEFEVSQPRPAEDPDWIDRQLAVLDGGAAADDLLGERRRERAAAWRRLVSADPRLAVRVRRKVERWARVARAREATRSELVRMFWVLRAFVVRAGELTGLGTGPWERPGDVFFLNLDEILARLDGLDGLDGDRTAEERIAVRREVFERFRALPVYPVLIRGHFDPFRWAADPARRTDVWDEDARVPPKDEISGFPGAAGVVEGLARVVASPEEGRALQAGEVLVTVVTNIGWTPLFPRAAAVVTDIGAPLSHAAIVARELGIPAVVGCGNATARLRTGDRVRVDGERGLVEVLTGLTAESQKVDSLM